MGRAVGELEDLTRDYRVAFQRYLPQRSEAALTLGYELGRSAVDRGTSPLDLVDVHHVVLSEVLADVREDRTQEVVAAAAEFLREVLATLDMVQRGIRAEDEGT